MSNDTLIKIEKVDGRGCVVRGDDVDTDRIIPARFMKEVTFDTMGEHAFEDARKDAKGEHPLDQERFRGSSILVVGQNFGCGSSREHAPQALMRFGFNAFIGGSFAEIFFGNCTALGLPCVTLSPADLSTVMDAIELDSEQNVEIDVQSSKVRCGACEFDAGIPGGTRKMLLEGSWDATRVLLDAGDLIEQTAERLPYVEHPA